MRETNDGTVYNSANFYYTKDTWYFLNITKIGTQFNASIYANSEDRILDQNHLGILNLTLHGNWEFKYIYGCNTANTGHPYQSMNRIRFLDIFPTIPYYNVTFYFNNGGTFRINGESISNGSTQHTIFYGTVLNLGSLPLNSSFVFYYFMWNSNNATTNPYNLTITENFTVWCYFSPISEFMDYTTPIALIVSFGLIISLLIIAKIKR